MPHDPLTVLIVDDEPLVSLFIKRILKESDENVLPICYDGASALEAIRTENPDLIFMDINIRGPMDGISVIRTAGQIKGTVYYISAYNSEEIISDALSTDPYNYLVKPIKEQEIRIAVTLARKKRNRPPIETDQNSVRIDPELYYDLLNHLLLQKGAPVSLTTKEGSLINLFARNLNIVLDTDTIKEAVWGEREVADSTLRDLISNLRQKIPQLIIETRFGQGYMLKSQ